LFTVLDAYGIQGAADDMVSNSWKVFDPSSSNENDGVFLEIVANAWDIGGHLNPIG
jgi:hypothetical protein